MSHTTDYPSIHTSCLHIWYLIFLSFLCTTSSSLALLDRLRQEARLQRSLSSVLGLSTQVSNMDYRLHTRI